MSALQPASTAPPSVTVKAPPLYQNKKVLSSQSEQNEVYSTQPAQPTVAQPVIPAQSDVEKQHPQALQHGQQPVQFVPAIIQPAGNNTAIVADNAISSDAVRMSYAQYITIPNLKSAVVDQIPKELSARGITQNEYASVIAQVKGIKSKSDNKKVALWTGCIFCCGIIGYLLVQQRAVGNRKLRKQLEAPLEEVNRELMNRGVGVRWLWVDGSLRAYYK